MKHLALLSLWLLSACGGTPYAITTGSHAPVQEPGGRYVVWSNHAGVGQYITGILLQNGYTVVERVRLQTLFNEQKVRLSHASDEDVLRVGRLVGASKVIFAEVRGGEYVRFGAGPAPPPSVTVRAVAVESGTVQWTGTALYSSPMQTPDLAVLVLTAWAINRAMCDGTWEEPSPDRKGGCILAGTVRTATEMPQEKSIWGAMQKMERW